MRKLTTLSAVALFATSFATTAWANINIQIADDLKLIAIDEQEVPSGGLLSKTADYTLDAGQHRLYVRYQSFFEDMMSDEHAKVKSETILLQTPALPDGQYRLQSVNAPSNLQAAQQYVQKPHIALYDAKGNMVAQQIGLNLDQNKTGLFQKSFDLTKNKLKNLVGMDTSPATISSTATVTPAVASVTPALGQPYVIPKKETATTATSSEQLIELWKKTPANEREKFLIWLNQSVR
ncbi:MAG: DUF2057 family protein [Acinetobacter sp.]|nr:DUF2057 family protein [Acinetobacter sp.]